MIAYDLGAHVGFYTLLFSRLVGLTGVVHAFEPVERNALYLRRHLQLNGATNVRVHELAVTHQTGTRAFDTSSGWSQARIVTHPAPGTTEVPAVSLDDFVYGGAHEPPDVVKMDVEGGEADVLVGMTTLLARKRPVLLVAAHGSDQRLKCDALLTEAGYDLVQLDGIHVRQDANRDEAVALPLESRRSFAAAAGA